MAAEAPPRAELAAAVLAGRAAAESGQTATVCPYPPGAALLRAAWVRGYARARPITARR